METLRTILNSSERVIDTCQYTEAKFLIMLAVGCFIAGMCTAVIWRECVRVRRAERRKRNALLRAVTNG